MNLIKEMHLTISDVYGMNQRRKAIMLKKLLNDAGVEDVIIEDPYPQDMTPRQDDELKLFVGAKPDKVIIHVRHCPVGG